jgi:hypothetical protein
MRSALVALTGRTWAVAVTSLALVGAVATPAAAGTTPAPPTFQTVKLPDAARGGTEPRVTIGPDGRRWVITNGAAGAVVFGSSDGGRTWTQTSGAVDQVDASIDVDIVAMHTGRLLATELDYAGLNFPSSYSDDGGKTWTPSVGSDRLVDQDRQWFAVGPDDPTTHQPRVYLLYHNFASGLASHNMWVATSSDGGATFGPPVPITLPGSDAYTDLQCADSGGPSSIAVNPKNGRIYVTFTTRASPSSGIDTGGCFATPLEFNIVNGTRVWVATSPDGTPGSWKDVLAVDDAATGQVVSMQLAYGALDNQGNMYVAYPESPHPYPDLRGAAVKYRYADPDLSKWSDPVSVVPYGGAGSVLVHMAVGDPGKLDIAYFKGADQPEGEPAWYLHTAQTLDARTSSPHFQDVEVSNVPAYKWTASHMMGICADPSPVQGVQNGLTCDRSTDVWGIALDSQCRLTVTWPTVSNDAPNANAGTYVSTQTGGPTVCGPQGPGAPSAAGLCVDRTSPTSHVARSSVHASRRSLSLSGTSKDRGCRKGKAKAALKGNVKRVSIAVARKVGSRCRYLRKSGGFGPSRSCAKAVYITARGTSRWSLKLRGSFPVGRYLARVRATDRRGNVEKPRGGAVITFRVR